MFGFGLTASAAQLNGSATVYTTQLMELWNKSAAVLSASAGAVVKSASHDDPHRTPQIVFMLVLFVFMVVANSSVILVTSQTRKSSRVKFFIMNLAIADLLNTLLSHLPDTIIRISGNWYADEITCRLLKYVMGVVSYASRYVLVAMTIDRLHAIVKPMSFTEGGRLSKILIGLAWSVALVFATPFLILSRLSTKSVTSCSMSFKFLQPLFSVSANNTQTFTQQAWSVYTTCIACLLLFIPALIIACCYSVIIAVVWNSQNQLGKIAPPGSSGCACSPTAVQDTSKRPKSSNMRLGHKTARVQVHMSDADVALSLADAASGSGTATASARVSTSGSVSAVAKRSVSGGVGCRRLESDSSTVIRTANRGVLPKAKMKSIYMTFVIVLAYVLCWTPFFLFNLLDVYRVLPQTSATPAVRIIIQSLSHLHSAVNPIIFYIYNRDAWLVFRRATALKVLCCCFKWGPWKRDGDPMDGQAARNSNYHSNYESFVKARMAKRKNGAASRPSCGSVVIKRSDSAIGQPLKSSYNAIESTANATTDDEEINEKTNLQTADASLGDTPKSQELQLQLKHRCASQTDGDDESDRPDDSDRNDAEKENKQSSPTPARKAPPPVRRTCTTIYIKQTLNEQEREVLLKYTSQV